MPARVRRAGSAYTPSIRSPSRSSASPSPWRTSASGKWRRLTVAIAAVSSSTSVASTSSSAAANAIASTPIPLVRSATRRIPASWYRRACRAATTSRLPCSSPACVKSMPSANAPSLPCAAARSRDWVRAAAARSGSTPFARSPAASTSACCSSYGGSAPSRAQPSGLSSLVSVAASMASILPRGPGTTRSRSPVVRRADVGTRLDRVLTGT
ncbi:Uncharacterised protein [Mycobacteroides abscessus]|nr:Uncharacterised protein [Mycobacteroides abscessus]